MNIWVVLNIIVMLVVMTMLYWVQKRGVRFSWCTFIAVIIGTGFGYILQKVYGPTSEVVQASGQYFNIVGSGYVALLKMITMPLIMVSIINAIMKLKGNQSLGKISSVCIGGLLFTVMIAALIGIWVALSFGLSAEGLFSGANEVSRGAYLLSKTHAIAHTSLPSMLLAIIPENPFLDMTGARSTSIIAVVIFSAFVGMAGLSISEKQPHLGAAFSHAIEVIHAIVMRIVSMVLRLTPYGILALITHVVATSVGADILRLFRFLEASYVALFIMFLVHLLLVGLMGGKPWVFVKKCLPTLVFAFTSRSSAASIPMNVETQVKRLGIPEGIANFAASFGATIGQNGCAGIYPAMLAVMIAPTMGVDPTSMHFILTLVLTIVIGSFGVAGVGGGATFAALIVLSAMNFPVALAGLLISIEPFIDMGRTAVNVSGAMTSGFMTSRILGETNMQTYNAPE